MTGYYLDTSAAIKLVVEEAESQAFGAWIQDQGPAFVASELLRVELLRACRRHSPDAMTRAREVIDSVIVMAVTTDICIDAAGIDPGVMRSLDAVHIATALAIGDDLKAVVTYDQRMAEGCRIYGLAVVSPT